MARKIEVEIIGDTSGLEKSFSKASVSTKGLFGTLAKGTLVVAGVQKAVDLTTEAVKIGWDEWTEANKISAQTNAVLKSTGNAANVTAKDVDTLATSIMKKSGMDDEAIASGENLLLTFTNIRNETGKGNDIFDQTTKIMADMSVALGQDTKSSALQLGKALNNPVKGVTALQRVGVSFTDSQKAQIKALVDSGKTMDAQKLILRELNKEFGGSAEAAGKTLPGQLNILKQNFSNLAGQIVATLAPALGKVAKLFAEHPRLMKAVVLAVVALSAAMVALNIAMAIYEARALISAAATGVWTAAQWLLNAALSANPIGLVVIAIVALVAAIILAYKKVDWFRKGVNAAFDAVKKAALSVFNWLKANWPLLLGILAGPFGLAVALIVTHWGKVSAACRAALDTVKKLLGGFVGWIVDTATKIVAPINKLVAAFKGLDDPVKTAVANIKAAINGLISWLSGIVSKVGAEATKIANAIKAPLNAILKRWNSLEFTVPKIKLPTVKVLGKKIGGGSFGGQTIGFPDVPLLARGGVVSAPTLAVVGEGPGREIVAPESLLREILADYRPTVRVFIGDTELKGLVRAEVRTENNRTAQTLIAGMS